MNLKYPALQFRNLSDENLSILQSQKNTAKESGGSDIVDDRSADSIKDLNKTQIRISTSLTHEERQARILIAESEPEILSLFKMYLDSFGLESVTVDNGDAAIYHFLKSINCGDKEYDVVILDTRLPDKSGLAVAKVIHDNDPSQKIVLITTMQKEQLPIDLLKSAGIEQNDVYTMPFKLNTIFKDFKFK